MRPTFALLATSLVCLIYSASLHAAESVEQSESYRECLALNSTAAQGGKIICEEAEKLKEANGQSAQPPAPSAPGASPEETALLERQLRTTCETELNKAESACTPTSYATPDASTGAGVSGAAAASGKLSENIGQQATQQVAACTDAVRRCRINCSNAYKSLKARCSGECGNDIYSPIRQLTLSCEKQLARQAGNKEQTKVAEKNKEEAQKIVDRIENKPTDLFPKNPSSGDINSPVAKSPIGSETGGNGGSLGSAGNGSTGGVSIPQAPTKTASTTAGQKSAQAANPATAEDKYLKEKSRERGLFGSPAMGDAVMESEYSGMNGMRGGSSAEAAAFYRALTAKVNEKSATAPTAAANAATAKAESAKMNDLARGKGTFMNAAEVRKAIASQSTPVNSANATAAPTSAHARGTMQPQSFNGAAIQQANNNGEFNQKDMNQDASRGPASESESSQFADQNDRMRMQRGDASGGSRYPSHNSVPLSAYLPNGSMYRGQRGPAGANPPSHGIQSQGVDIWSLISKRMQARCLDGRLRDCR